MKPRCFRILQFLAGGLWLLPSALAEPKKAAPVRPPLDASRAPIHLKPLVTALGTRASSPGFERLLFTGTLVDAKGGTQLIKWTWETPGKVRVEYDRKRKPLVFDLRTANPVGNADEHLLATLAEDTADSFLHAVLVGNIPRVLGTRFRVHAGDGAFGSFLDIYEIAVPAHGWHEPETTAKQFMFDSATHLLRQTSHHQQREAERERIMTRYSRYEPSPAGPIARTIERLVGKETLFRIEVTSVRPQRKRDDKAFKVPK